MLSYFFIPFLLFLVPFSNSAMQKELSGMSPHRITAIPLILPGGAESKEVIKMIDTANDYVTGTLAHKPDYPLAFHWYSKAAELGNPFAMANVGALYLGGFDGQKPDYTKAEEWLLKAVRAGCLSAIANLEILYLDKAAQESHKEELWLTKAAELGNTEAMGKLSIIFLKRGDDSWAEKLLTQAAHLGDATAMTNLGILFLKKETHSQQAYQWLTKAAHKKETNAMISLAEMYTHGLGLLQPNYSKAIELLTEADTLGHRLACELLSAFYFAGKGVPRNYEKAFTLLSKAASFNSANAMCNIGFMYQGGYIGNKPNDRLALHWYNKARQQGHTEAFIYLAAMYVLGLGMDNPNLTVAIKLLEDARQNLQKLVSKTDVNIHQEAFIEKELERLKEVD